MSGIIETQNIAEIIQERSKYTEYPNVDTR